MWKYAALVNILYLISIVNDVDGQGRVAPGVPPQHYQQAPPQQYQQQQQPQFQQQQVPQQQMHQQQMPQQQQQMPQQHVPQQHVPQQQAHVPQQQVPVQQQYVPQQQAHHAHHGVPQPGQILNAANIVQEKEHIAEHMEVPMDTSKMTDQELQFHYFKMHDADNNNELDGCELIKSLIHWHDPESEQATSILTDESLSEMIDPLLKTIDENKDGFIDYTEYKKHID